MKTNLIELINKQREVNEVVNARLEENELKLPDAADYLLAMHVEFFEFINELGLWKWWKHNHKLDKEKVLDELADIMAFFLSLIEYDVNTQFLMDEMFEEAQKELESFDTIQIIKSISVGIEYGDNQLVDLNSVILMGVAIELARRTVDATWEEVEAAYLKKSEENINRQKTNY